MIHTCCLSVHVSAVDVAHCFHPRSLMRRLPPAGIANGASTWQDRTVMDIVGSTWREMDTKCQCNGKHFAKRCEE